MTDSRFNPPYSGCAGAISIDGGRVSVGTPL
ncbi:hypothetical protein AWB72_04338 [Caballeronia concitans]|uniref:Uncharacterized protein n=1 Tax=Caballeronia concitans TaxID=1777133 RepID=A0A658R205_9BURK|nr:hypothetical protein BurMR1_3849 [Burkholderia sp. MR1]SAL41415.1 hypothetical protein AWB72_04338 [Caballeronia concitans]